MGQNCCTNRLVLDKLQADLKQEFLLVTLELLTNPRHSYRQLKYHLNSGLNLVHLANNELPFGFSYLQYTQYLLVTICSDAYLKERQATLQNLLSQQQNLISMNLNILNKEKTDFPIISYIQSCFIELLSCDISNLSDAVKAIPDQTVMENFFTMNLGHMEVQLINQILLSKKFINYMLQFNQREQRIITIDQLNIELNSLIVNNISMKILIFENPQIYGSTCADTQLILNCELLGSDLPKKALRLVTLLHEICHIYVKKYINPNNVLLGTLPYSYLEDESVKQTDDAGEQFEIIVFGQVVNGPINIDISQSILSIKNWNDMQFNFGDLFHQQPSIVIVHD